MSSEWDSLTVGDLVKSGEAIVQTGPFGSQLHSYDYVTDGVAVIPTEAIGRGSILNVPLPQVSVEKAKELARHRLSAGDILFARRGAQATGLSAIIDERYEGGLCGTGALLLRIRSKRVDPQFLAMYLSSEETYNWLRTHAVGAVMPNINTDIIKALPIYLPSIEEQRNLASFLGAVDDRISLLRETNTTLEAIAQALFKSWFVDFDPVRAKMEGRVPEGMDEATAALFPDSLEGSELGEVPNGWLVDLLSNLISLHKGSVNPSASPDAEFQHFSLPSYDASQMPVVEIGSAIKSNKTTVPVDAVLLSKLNPHIPRIWLPSNIGSNAVCSTEFLPFVPYGSATTVFIYCLLAAPNFIKTLTQLVTGTSNSHQRIRPDGVLSLVSVIPSAAVMSAFDEVTTALFDRLKANREESNTLENLRDSLLPRLISGQIRLPEAQIHLEDALA